MSRLSRGWREEEDRGAGVFMGKQADDVPPPLMYLKESQDASE